VNVDLNWYIKLSKDEQKRIEAYEKGMQEYYSSKVVVTTKCPTCGEDYTREVYVQEIEYGTIGLEVCDKCPTTINLTKRYEKTS
jgi:hypothetical protein